MEASQEEEKYSIFIHSFPTQEVDQSYSFQTLD